MNEISSPRLFWEAKILKWERARYSKRYLFYPLSWSIRARLRSAFKTIMVRASPDWSFVELGCGSGYLAEKIKKHFQKYVGYDFAGNAITEAKQKLGDNNFHFLAADVRAVDLPLTNLTVFLGLTDWLDINELKKLFLKCKSDHLLFSFTDCDAVSLFHPYQLYRLISDRKFAGNTYNARGYNEDEIRAALLAAGYSFEKIGPSSFFNPGVLVWADKKR